MNNKTNFIILAFANINPDGSIRVDDANFPRTFVTNWRNSGKKVLLSVGGQSGNWSFAFATTQSSSLFAKSLASAVTNYKLDGVDLDLEYYSATPRMVANTIKDIKSRIGTKLLVVSPECVTVYQGTGVPSADSTTGNYFNYLVPIIRLAGSSIDYYQIQAYNNWYDGLTPGSLDYLKDVYLNWRNLQGLNTNFKPILNFSGVPGSKILMGVMASNSAGGSTYYYSPSTIQSFKSYLSMKGYSMKGFMIWDSHWDSLNSYIISNTIKQ